LLGRASWPAAAALAVCQVLGAVAPPALYLAWCSAAGSVAATVYWFRFNFSYVGAGLGGLAAVARGLRRTALIGSVALVPYALGLSSAAGVAAALARAIRRRRAPASEADVPPP